MKIRHKQSGVVLEGKFCMVGEGNGRYSRTYYRLVGLEPSSQYDTSEWEEVKPEWVDVTADCEWEHGVLTYRGNPLSSHAFYRLRKVPYDSIRIGKCGEMPDDCITKGSAFIIEKVDP